MTNDEQQVSQARRKFIRDAGLTGGAAAVAAAAPGVALAEAPETAAEGSKQPEGYRLTKHILAYYKSAAS
jgi:nitrous oxide reductase